MHQKGIDGFYSKVQPQVSIPSLSFEERNYHLLFADWTADLIYQLTKRIVDEPNDQMFELREKENKAMPRDILKIIASMKYSVPFYCDHIAILHDGDWDT